jgi:arylsulfatase A-like enzyme
MFETYLQLPFFQRHTMQSIMRLLAVLVMLCGSALAAESRPNIIFLFTDDQTARAIGCAGTTDFITPHLDRLASDGVQFTNHYNTTSICMASRCSVLTGLYEYRHGCNFGHGDLERRFIEKSYPVLLRKSGYFTGFAGKVGFVLKDEKFDALAPLFDRWAGGPGQTFYETVKNEGIAKYADKYPHCSRAYGA